MCQISKARTPRAPAKPGHGCCPPRSSLPRNSPGSPCRGTMRSALTAVQEHFVSVPATCTLANIDVRSQYDRCFVTRRAERELRLEVEDTRFIKLSIRFSRSAPWHSDRRSRLECSNESTTQWARLTNSITAIDELDHRCRPTRHPQIRSATGRIDKLDLRHRPARVDINRHRH